jgi:PAS domain S-box-containing protein
MDHLADFRGPAEAQPDTDFFLPFQRVPIPMQSMGPDRLLLEVNEAWVAYTGYCRAEAIGRSFADFLDAPSADLYRNRAVPEFIETVPASESRAVEYRLIKRSGELANIVLTARPQRDPATGRFLHSLSVINDITARSRAEAALRQAQKLESLGRLTSGVAHDFNNLLTIILGSLELLSRRLPPGDVRANRLVGSALEGTRRGAALTSRLLAFSRQQELEPLPLEPAQVFAALRPMLSQLLGPAITLSEDLPPGLWNLHADPGQLELALLNLAANARDAMPSGGHLSLAARNVTIAPIESAFLTVSAQAVAPPGNHVVLTVADDGIGMDEEALARAADPFFTTKGLGKGTGLGLSMVHGFALQSGGAMLIASRPGAGTSVELWLPRSMAPSQPARPATISVAPPPGRQLRVLLVDDDKLVVGSTTGMLEELGHRVVSATSGEAALAILQEGSFDLLLTDLMMPGMGGLQLAARVRAEKPGLPILLASGYAEMDALAGTDWPRLRKPYDLTQLAAALAAF